MAEELMEEHISHFYHKTGDRASSGPRSSTKTPGEAAERSASDFWEFCDHPIIPDDLCDTAASSASRLLHEPSWM